MEERNRVGVTALVEQQRRALKNPKPQTKKPSKDDDDYDYGCVDVDKDIPFAMGFIPGCK